MKVVQRYETSDGVIHESYEKAHKHADNRYGSILTELAWKLAQICKYKDMIAFLEDDANIQKFLDLQKLKDDIKVETKDDSDDSDDFEEDED